MKIKCGDCSHIQEIIVVAIIFDDEDEDTSVILISDEFLKSKIEYE